MTSTFKVKIGINPISWCNDDLPSLGGETTLDTILREGSEIGYQGFELGNKFPRTAAELKAVLAPYGVECVSGWYSGYLAERSAEEEIAAVEGHLSLLVESGCQVMVYGEVGGSIQGQIGTALYKRPTFTSEEAWQQYAAKLNTFAAHLASRGIKLAYHHHMGAFVETPADVDKLMLLTSPDVGLLFDTGHMYFAGGDPLTELNKHIDRVVHVHCKDVRAEVLRRARNGSWSFLQSVLNGAFTVPGDGDIQFGPILARLAQHGYQGWLVVEAEQDPTIAPSYEYAQKGFNTLSGLVAGLS
ncbi:myo-inosose-2 dehydratase [Vogesella alkaliphila]|uniref:Myo-inosose-2 dehydratase n=1 Tax=Vogesella alkaliphila TaxID=1193621 RepID=A0ABQ2YD08_9NEIS|nr:myo-inosose-2 dehydratase [Vogesella alkaliphila]GGX78986.1 myo-inosose-2 dehydratase [Vogesella alkaliphila]